MEKSMVSGEDFPNKNHPSMKKSVTSQAARAQEVHLVAERLAAGDDVDTQDAERGKWGKAREWSRGFF